MANQDQVRVDSAMIADDPAQGPRFHPHVAGEGRRLVTKFMLSIYHIMGGGGGRNHTSQPGPSWQLSASSVLPSP